MQVDISKLDRQKSGTQAWRSARGIGTLNWTPRFGKTYGAIMFIIDPHLKINSTNYTIIIVSSEIIQKHWTDNLKSYCDNLDRVAVYTTSFLSTNVNEIRNLECSLIVVDEIQKFITPERKAMIDGTLIKHHYRLALTGTYPFGIQWIEDLYPIVDTVTEEEAISNKWISPFVEYNILLNLPQADKARYEKFSQPISETLEMFKPIYPRFTREEGKLVFEDEFKMIVACKTGFKTVNLQGQDTWITYDRLCNSISLMLGWHTMLDITIPENEELHKLWSPLAIHNRAKQFVDYVTRRNDLLINNTVKLEAVGNIIEKNKVSTICFNESTAFADRVADYINSRFGNEYHAACYHSQMDSRTMIDPTTGEVFKYTTGSRKGLPKVLGKDSIKKIVIDGTRLGYYNFLSTAQALNEGVDIPIIEQVICTGGTTNPITYQQRTARGKTIDIYNPDKVTKIFNLVFDDFTNLNGELIKSRDKNKLILRQRLTGASVKWVSDLNEINLDAMD